MTVLVRILCGACGCDAGIGLDAQHALFDVTERGGRVIGDVSVCSGCAKVTR